ncbi:MAG: MBL fold metallo-hydrolase [Candidatus Latescibacteria bacterium]|nr:MBL fold metallo-hydrolase [Candidatus Latescibacterota bacterium]
MIAVSVFMFVSALSINAQKKFETDTIKTSDGDLKITFIGHGTLMFTFNDLIIHIDPWSVAADYSKLPNGDIILLTHNHTDHLDPKALNHIIDENTTLIYTQQCANSYPGGVVMRNGMTWKVKGLLIEAVPAYCLIPRDDPRSQPHTKGECNGYILTFGDKRVYIASETENIPELKEVSDIDVAFIAMDSIFNLTPTEAIDAVKAFNPKVIYPYHYADADLTPFLDAFKDNPSIEVRVKNMKIK